MHTNHKITVLNETKETMVTTRITLNQFITIITLIAIIGGGFYWFGSINSAIHSNTDVLKEVKSELSLMRQELISMRKDFNERTNAISEAVLKNRDKLLRIEDNINK